MISDRNQSPKRPTRSAAKRSSGTARAGALLVIDHERLQAAAWAELHLARKRFEKASRDLRRHEEIDAPAYDSWLHRTFPILITRLRELHAEVGTKARKIQMVQAMSAYSGGSLKRLWREQKARETAEPESFEDERESADENDDGDDADFSDRRRNERSEEDERSERAPGPTPSSDARAVYRRLVQKLHPDRGGEWTAARERRWHEVQQAWAAADADWLSRLDADWDEAHEVVGPTSPVSRLRRAIEELHAGRRDTERKLREYRHAPSWRFTKTEKRREELHRHIADNFMHDLSFLQRQLDHLNATIAAWEDDWKQPQRRRSRRRQSQRF